MPFQILMASGRTLLADGAMATNLFDRGLGPGDAPEGWISLHPDRIVALHAAFVAAGADLVLTNSFGANVCRLAPRGLEDRVEALNRDAVQLARLAVRDAGRPVAIAGSVGPTGLFHGPDTAPGRDVLERVFDRQVAALAEAGADLLWLETFGAADEMRAAATAAGRSGLPYVLTASFEREGLTGAGLSPEAFAALALGLDVPPAAIGANCGAGPADALAIVGAIGAAAPSLRLALKPNAGLPILRNGAFVYPATPAEMGDLARRAVAMGVSIVGGCCGTRPAHVAAMRQALAR